MKMWRERIMEARRRGQFTREDRMDAGDRGWAPYARCAVGEQADRYGAGLIFSCIEARVGVKDAALERLGGRFYSAVMSDDVALSDMLLDQIEDRALQLKREVTS